MLIHPLYAKLTQLRLAGMLLGLKEQMNCPEVDRLSFEERLGLLVDRQITARENHQLAARLKKARLRQNACVEDVDFRHRRGLDQAQFLQLAQCAWIKEHHNVLIIGPTGVGKTYLACALAHKACREGYGALYFRLPRLLQELALARGDGRYVSLLKTIARADLLEILEDRHGLRSTLITSQLPTDHWHELITNATVADAICDRLVHNGYRITLKGESMRKLKNQLT